MEMVCFWEHCNLLMNQYSFTTQKNIIINSNACCSKGNFHWIFFQGSYKRNYRATVKSNHVVNKVHFFSVPSRAGTTQIQFLNCVLLRISDNGNPVIWTVTYNHQNLLELIFRCTSNNYTAQSLLSNLWLSNILQYPVCCIWMLHFTNNQLSM
jgi:hypothetical protein